MPRRKRRKSFKKRARKHPLAALLEKQGLKAIKNLLNPKKSSPTNIPPRRKTRPGLL